MGKWPEIPGESGMGKDEVQTWPFMRLRACRGAFGVWTSEEGAEGRRK